MGNIFRFIMMVVDINMSIKIVNNMEDTEISEKMVHYNNKEYIQMVRKQNIRIIDRLL